MAFTQSKSGKTRQVLKDLIKINNDRIGWYQSALGQQDRLEPQVRELINDIISEGMLYRQQLLQAVKQLQGETGNDPNILGIIYTAWRDLRVAFSGNSQRAIVSSCLYSEEIALHSYRAALGNDQGISEEVSQLLGEHINGFRRNYDMLKCYRGSRYAEEISLNYLV